MTFVPPTRYTKAIERTGDKDRLRNLRENVMLVVRDYNKIINALSVSERRLFLDKLRALERKVHPGLVKLTWCALNSCDDPLSTNDTDD